jgi:hypothetical protein
MAHHGPNAYLDVTGSAVARWYGGGHTLAALTIILTKTNRGASS